MKYLRLRHVGASVWAEDVRWVYPGWGDSLRSINSLVTKSEQKENENTNLPNSSGRVPPPMGGTPMIHNV